MTYNPITQKSIGNDKYNPILSSKPNNPKKKNTKTKHKPQKFIWSF